MTIGWCPFSVRYWWHCAFASYYGLKSTGCLSTNPFIFHELYHVNISYYPNHSPYSLSEMNDHKTHAINETTCFFQFIRSRLFTRLKISISSDDLSDEFWARFSYGSRVYLSCCEFNSIIIVKSLKHAHGRCT